MAQYSSLANQVELLSSSGDHFKAKSTFSDQLRVTRVIKPCISGSDKKTAEDLVKSDAKSVVKNEAVNRVKQSVVWAEKFVSESKDKEELEFRYPKCACWPVQSAFFPKCSSECLYQTDQEYLRKCECLHKWGQKLRRADCDVCALNFHCKTTVINAVTLNCSCVVGGRNLSRFAKDCHTCCEKVRKLLTPYYPACWCKSASRFTELEDLYQCELFCIWQLSAVYKQWFINAKRPVLFLWHDNHLITM